jgi:hypothetical protein
LSALAAPQRDAVTVLSGYLLLLFAIPAQLVVGPLGALGTPALLVAFFAAWWWLVARLHPGFGIDRRLQPMRLALLAYCGYVTLVYVLTWFRPMTALEVSGSTRTLLLVAAFTGLALLAADGIHSRDRLETLLRRLVLGAGIVAAIGIIQFLTSFDPTRFIRLPGLVENHAVIGIGGRSIFNRPYGTMRHPIEFGVVLGMLLPLALHFALQARPGRQRAWRWAQVGLIATGVMMSVSRSGIIAMIVGLAVVALAWSWRRRLNAVVYGGIFTVVMWALVPGLVGTLRSLFVNTEYDPSVQARIERIPRVVELVSQRPWFGQGPGTFTPEEYFLLDNQYFGTAIELGIIGVVMMLFLWGMGLVVLFRVASRTADQATRQLCYAMAGGIAAIVVCAYTFDVVAYHVVLGVLFLLLGAAGALWRLELPASRAAPRTTPAMAGESSAID